MFKKIWRRIFWLRNIPEWFNITLYDLFKAAVSTIKITMMIGNLRKEMVHEEEEEEEDKEEEESNALNSVRFLDV